MGSVQYDVVFDASQTWYQWWWPAFGLIFVAIGALWTLYDYRHPPAWWRRLHGPFVTAFAVLWVVLAAWSTYRDYAGLRRALTTGQYVTVEGTVTNFVPMPREGHADEHFEVAGHRYSYSDYGMSAGFNKTQSHGGPMREGLRVRIADVGGVIARLEIAR